MLGFGVFLYSKQGFLYNARALVPNGHKWESGVTPELARSGNEERHDTASPDTANKQVGSRRLGEPLFKVRASKSEYLPRQTGRPSGQHYAY